MTILKDFAHPDDRLDVRSLLESQRQSPAPEIQLIDKHVDHPHRVGLMANTAANSVLAADDEPSLRHWFAKKDLPEKC